MKKCLLVLVPAMILVLTSPLLAGESGAEPAGKPETLFNLSDKPEMSLAKSGCSASAACWNGTTLSCSGNNSCLAQDSSCPFSDGYVSCDGVAQYCSPCPSVNCPMENRMCRRDSDCNSAPGCNGCFCSTLELGFAICECPF